MNPQWKIGKATLKFNCVFDYVGKRLGYCYTSIGTLRVNFVDVTVCVTEACRYKSNNNRESSAEVTS
jgi:hypothetical protein